MEEIKNRNHVAARKKDAEDSGHSTSSFVEQELNKAFMELRVNKTQSRWEAVLIDTHNCDSVEVASASTFGAMMSTIS
jgi:hypothetical protein